MIIAVLWNDLTGHEALFRQRFWVRLLLSIPVLLYSPMLQEWLRFSMPAFPGSQWLEAACGMVIFAYGGVPYLQMAVPELKSRQPGMMTLISLAIGVAIIYSLAALALPGQMGFFWEGGSETALAGIMRLVQEAQQSQSRTQGLADKSRASHRKMVQNLLWATGYNVVALLLAAGVLAPRGILLSPAAGAVLMSLSTIIVAINAQMLRRQTLAG